MTNYKITLQKNEELCKMLKQNKNTVKPVCSDQRPPLGPEKSGRCSEVVVIGRVRLKIFSQKFNFIEKVTALSCFGP